MPRTTSKQASNEVTAAEANLARQQDQLDSARSQARQELAHWAARWADPDAGSRLPAGLVPALETALERAGEAGADPLSVTFRAQVEDLHDALVTQRNSADDAHLKLSQQIDRALELRAEIAAERDDAPADNDLRTADRCGRAGAPFWQLVRFRGEVPPAQAAAVEGALYGANLLTAWVHPDGELTRASLRGGEVDGFLVPLPPAARPRGATLADVLVAEEQELVPAERIVALLASISLPSVQETIEDTAEPTAPAEPVAAGVPDAPTGSPWTAVVTRHGQFALGVQVGAHPKDAAEFIGATARARRRAARLTSLDRELDDLTQARGEVEKSQRDVEQAVSDLKSAQKNLPPISAIATAERACARAAATVEAARTRHDQQRRLLDRRIAEVDLRRRRLQQGASERAMPIDSTAVEHVARAVAEFKAPDKH